VVYCVGQVVLLPEIHRFPKPARSNNISGLALAWSRQARENKGITMQVREILRVKGSTLFTASPQQLLSDAVAAMAEHDVGSLVVMGGGRMVGMLTFREVIKALNEHKTADSVRVESVMVHDPVTVAPDMEVDDLRRLMIEKHSRYLPVMDGTVLMGVISFLDVAKAVLEEQSFENRMLKNYIRNWPDGEKTPE
jgi:CBS domain-containing protein